MFLKECYISSGVEKTAGMAASCNYSCKNISPSHRDAWVQVVELGGAKGNLLVLFAIGRLHFQLHQLFLYPLNCILLGLHSPAKTKYAVINMSGTGFKLIPLNKMMNGSLPSGFLISLYFGISLGAL